MGPKLELQEVVRTSSQSAKAAVLLVHGLNGSRLDMEELATVLNEHGFDTVNLLLPGHGTHMQALLASGWPDWSEAVLTEVLALKQRYSQVFLVGHSLGGALCLHTAAQEAVAGIVTMCAPLDMRIWMLPAVRLARRFVAAVPSLREDIHDPLARQRYPQAGRRQTPMAPVESMLQYLPGLRQEIRSITIPALVMHARYDHVVPLRDGRTIYRLLGSSDKEFLLLRNSYHAITKDYERHLVFQHTLTFIQRVLAQYEQ